MSKKNLTFIFSLLLFVLIAVGTTGCNENTPPDASGIEAQSIGQGETVFRLEVTDNEEKTTVWDVRTNEATVGAALLEAGLIEGTVGEWGLMVSHVNGLRADFTEDGYWWAFYIDGEMAMAGVDSTDIEEGVIYAFVYTPA
jgi:hypothetical protein